MPIVLFCFFVYGEKKGRNKKNRLRRKMLRAQNRAQPASRAAAVALKGYFDPNVAPAQQRNS